MLRAIEPPCKVRIKYGIRTIDQPIGWYPMTVKREVRIHLEGNEGLALRETDSSIEVQVLTLPPRWYARDEIEFIS